MAWGLRKMEVTLEDKATGETLRLEQGPDGKVSCEEKSGKPKAKPASTEHRPAKPAAAPRAETKTAAAKPETPKAAQEPGEKSSKGKNAKRVAKRKTTSLVWTPCVDHGFHGFKAPSAGGQFKLLKSSTTQWALFYELRGTDARKAGCFKKENDAKVKAQALHDAGWPGNESDGSVTAADLADACPMPSNKKGEEPEMKAEQKKPAAKPSAPEPTPAPAPAPSKSEAEQDKELMGSFTSELDGVLDEEEDD